MINLNSIKLKEMSHSGFKARIMEAERLRGETAFGLPPGSPLDIIPLDCLPGAPVEWIRESGSFIVPVKTEKGIWFDFTMNNQYNTGVVLSIKGMNPITGKKINDLNLEQYRCKCPIHGKEFAHNLFCEECKYEWPGQNYLSSPNILWIDGFRQTNGEVRQFFFTEQDSRDVASAMIGKENTVPAFGFAFFKNKREVSVIKEEKITSHPYPIFGGVTPDFIEKNTLWVNGDFFPSYPSPSKYNNDNLDNYYFPPFTCTASLNTLCCANNIESNELNLNKAEKKLSRSVKYQMNLTTKNVSVGAGAKINQKLEIDTLPLDEWYQEPQGLIRLYFVFGEQLNTIINNGGIKKLESVENGYMNNKVEVG
jgi:hypothetical protein